MILVHKNLIHPLNKEHQHTLTEFYLNRNHSIVLQIIFEGIGIETRYNINI